MNEQTNLQLMRSLTDSERIEARHQARVNIQARYLEPAREHFDHYTAAKYPRWVTVAIGGVMLIVFLAAGAPSLFRLFTAGRDTFLTGIADMTQANITGFSTFLLAEFLVILSTISARVFFEGRARLAFVIPIVLGTITALIGNWVVAQPVDFFGWLETVSPPVAVLTLALIGERIIFESIDRRHANERAYQAAYADWKQATSDPENSPEWLPTYANTLRETIASKNRRFKDGREALPQLTTADWRALVSREMRSDAWYLEPVNGAEIPHLEPLAGYSNGNGKGYEPDPFALPRVTTSNGTEY